MLPSQLPPSQDLSLEEEEGCTGLWTELDSGKQERSDIGVVSGREWGHSQLPPTASCGLRHRLPACALFLFCLYFDCSLRQHKSWQSNPNALFTNSRNFLHYRGCLPPFYVKHCDSLPRSLSRLFQVESCHFSPPAISPPTTTSLPIRIRRLVH